MNILQIIPATDWYALIKDKNGGMSFDPIPMWALVEVEEDGKKYKNIKGVCETTFGLGNTDPDNDPDLITYSNHAGYCHKSQIERLNIKFNQNFPRQYEKANRQISDLQRFYG